MTTTSKSSANRNKHLNANQSGIDRVEPSSTAHLSNGDVIAVDAQTASRMFSVSLRTWRRWESSGRCPRAFRIGKRTLWRLSDLRAWADEGFGRINET